jgi:hypothetical protein
MFTCGPAFWLSSSGTGWGPANDPYFSSVIFQTTFEAATFDTQNISSFDVDESTYNRVCLGSSALVTTSNPIEGTYSFRGPYSASGLTFGGYAVGAEGDIGTQAWTFECVVDVDATLHRTPTTAFVIHGQFGPQWTTNAVQLCIHNGPPYQNILTLFVHNFSAGTPLLQSTLDLRGAGPSHIGFCTDGAGNWYLFARGQILDTATWGGSATTNQQRSFAGSFYVQSEMPGEMDYIRETVGVCRYTSAYTPLAGAQD